MMTESYQRHFRKVIRIRAEDSPNVRSKDSGALVPGVLTYREYQKRRATWDPIRQCIGLDAMFYEGAEILLYPPDWLNHSEHLWGELEESTWKRRAKGIGIDPGEGGAETAISVVDELGLLEMFAFRTPDTSIIGGHTLAKMKEWKVEADRVIFDRGGGGKQIADTLRALGHPVRTVGFGEAVTPDPPYGMAKPTIEEVEHGKEQRYEYVNRRAQMYGELRELLDPRHGLRAFAISPKEYELRRQLAPLPLLYDAEGRLRMLRKNKPPGSTSKEKTIVDLLGCSPDRADALVLAVHAMLHREAPIIAQVF